MTNPFEQLAEKQMVAASKAKHRRREVKVVQSEKDAPMKLSEREQEQADQSKQYRAWKAWKREELEAIRQSPDGDDLRDLEHLIRQMSFDGVTAITEYIYRSKWLHRADHRTRTVVLSMIASAIIRLRLENGLPPFDDSLPDEEPTLFENIRNQLKVLT